MNDKFFDGLGRVLKRVAAEVKADDAAGRTPEERMARAKAASKAAIEERGKARGYSEAETAFVVAIANACGDAFRGNARAEIIVDELEKNAAAASVFGALVGVAADIKKTKEAARD